MKFYICAYENRCVYNLLPYARHTQELSLALSLNTQTVYKFLSSFMQVKGLHQPTAIGRTTITHAVHHLPALSPRQAFLASIHTILYVDITLRHPVYIPK